MALAVFSICLAALVYVYLAYPLVLSVLPKQDLSVGGDLEDEQLPTVSLVIAAYNEEDVIGQKIENSLALAYPRDKLEIWVASDGSTDRTNEILRRAESQGILVNNVTPRGGKTRALNRTVPLTSGEILVFSDANAMYRPDAIRKLVRHFQNPAVGGVSGDVRLLNDDVSFGQAEKTYYRYERKIQHLEGEFHSVIGADGAMYAIRRELFVPPPDDIVLDDFVISMTVARQGYRVIYDPEAVAVESATPDAAQEFRRKVRISGGAVQALVQGKGLPKAGQWKLLYCYVSHKLLRWLSPVFLVGLLASNVFLVPRGGWAVAALGAQAAFYLLALVAATLRVDKLPRSLQIPYFFVLQNTAYFLGGIRGAFCPPQAMWERTGR